VNLQSGFTLTELSSRVSSPSLLTSHSALSPWAPLSRGWDGRFGPRRLRTKPGSTAFGTNLAFSHAPAPSLWAPLCLSPCLSAVSGLSFPSLERQGDKGRGKNHEVVEPPTPGLTGQRTTSLSPSFFNNLTLQTGPVCDHSVTSADVRLSVGTNDYEANESRPASPTSLAGHCLLICALMRRNPIQSSASERFFAEGTDATDMLRSIHSSGCSPAGLSTPLSRYRTAFAKRAAWGSCVTITMVLS
jgi:hypothetical protein